MPALGDAAGNIRFDAPKLPGQQCKEDYMLVINGELSGPQGDQWWIDVNGGKYKMGKGRSPIQMSLLWPATRIGSRFKRETRRHLGVYDRPAKDSRRSGTGEKTGRNLPLEFRLHGDSDVGSWIDSLLLIVPKKIELACDRDTCARNDLERFETGISHLRTSAVLAVLNDGVV
jgi:hypothetical protein